MDSSLSEIRRLHPLIHCISNIVTANDCANLLLAIGASPIMAQAPEEMAEISARAAALVMNTGTPSVEKFAACLNAGRAANDCGIPLVLDPVGVGASAWRLEKVSTLLEQVHASIIRANAAEARALLGVLSDEHGVDSVAKAGEDTAVLAETLARKYNCTVLLSGEVDTVSDGERSATVSGGSAMMKSITGAGCMLSCLCGAFAAVERPYDAAVHATRLWKKTAKAAERLAANRGLGTYHMALFDAITSTDG